MDKAYSCPEDLLIRACMHCALDREQKPAEGLVDQVDWDLLFQRVMVNRALGPVLDLEKIAPGIWPDHFQRKITTYRLSLLVHAEQEVQRVTSIVERLCEAGIRVVVLKGWEYITTVYGGDYSLRPSGDIDLLVMPDEVRRAEGVLAELGIGPLEELWPGTRFRYGNAAFHYGRLDVSLSRGEFGVDLHWELFNIRYLDARISLEDVFSRAEPMAIGKAKALRLGTEDHLCHAMGHRSFHHPDAPELFRFYELAWTIRNAQPAVDWRRVAERSSKWGIQPVIRPMLQEMEALFPGTLRSISAEDWASLAPDPGQEKIVQQIIKYVPTPLGRLVPMRWSARGLIETLGFLFEAFIPGPRFLEHRYGRSRFWPLQYIKRLINAWDQLGGFLRMKPPSE